MSSKNEKKESPAKKFAKLVTEGPEEYRKKYEGLNEEEIAQKMTDEMNQRQEYKQNRRHQQSDWSKHNFDQPTVKHPNLGARIFWGVLLLIAAGVLGAQAFDLYNFAINPWWLILSAFLVAFGIATAVGRVWFFTFTSLAGLITIANYQTDWLPIDMTSQQIGWLWGAAVLMSIAFAVLFHRRGWSKMGGVFIYDPSNESIDDSSEADGIIRVKTSFGETIKYIDSQNLRRLELNNSFGGQKIYLDGAKLSAQGVNVVVNNSFGGIELYVPKNWKVMNGLNNFGAGVSEKNRAFLSDKSPILRLSGQQNLAGIEIIYV